MKKVISTDFDEIADSINGVVGEFVPTGRSTASWSVHVVDAGRTAAQILQVGGATTFSGDGQTDAVTIGIPLTLPSGIHLNGQVLTENSFLLVEEAQPFTVAARGMMRWAGITVPLQYGLTLPRENRFSPRAHVQTNLHYLTRIKVLVARLCAEESQLPLHEAAAQAAESDIVSVATLALEASVPTGATRAGRPRYCRAQILRRSLELLESSDGALLTMRELCKQTGVSERTLRNVFLEHFGVGPMRLLRVRRLCAVRSALMQAKPGVDRIREIARSFGIWDLSDFTQQYKQLFGELPSQTLNSTRQPCELEVHRLAHWAHLTLRSANAVFMHDR